MAFTNSSVLVLDDTGAVHDYQAAQSSPLSVAIPAGSTGTWSWVVSRAGYGCQVGTFDAAGGGVDSASPTPSQRLQPSGAVMYTSTSDPNITVSFDLTPSSERCLIDIADASVTSQAVFDEVEAALETQDGCRFLAATSCAEVTLAQLPAGNFLFLGTGYRFRRAAPGDVNAAVQAFAISVDGTPVDGANGSVTLLSANLTADEVAEAVESALLDEADGRAVLAAIAAQVRTELSAELSLLDVAVSTRSSHAAPDVSGLATSAEVAALPTPPTEGDIADAVWDEDRATHIGAGSYGATSEWTGSVSGTVDANIVSVTATPVTDVDDFKAVVDNGAIADAVLDEAIADHLTAGSVGEAINTSGGGASPSAVADAVLGELVSEHQSAGSLGRYINEIYGNTETSIPLQINAISTPLTAAEVKSEVDQALVDYDAATGAELAAAEANLTAEHDDTQAAVAAISIGSTVTADIVSVGGVAVTSPDDFKATRNEINPENVRSRVLSRDLDSGRPLTAERIEYPDAATAAADTTYSGAGKLRSFTDTVTYEPEGWDTQTTTED